MRTIPLRPSPAKLSTLTLLLIAGTITVAAQTPTPTPASPVKVVEGFWKVETAGGTLTPEGWYKANEFFIRPGNPPRHAIVNVIRNGLVDYVEETARAATWAEVSVTTDSLGEIDSLLRFKPYPKVGPAGVLLIKGPMVAFDLVLTDRQWRINRDGAREKASVLPQQWLITCGGDTTWINLDAAISYVKELRAKTSDPVVRRNAGETLQHLKHLQ